MLESTPPVVSSSVTSQLMPTELLTPSAPTLVSAPSTSVTNSVTPTPIKSATPTESVTKKDAKEPILVLTRGGRTITLPPIERPTTRSKKLQAKVDDNKSVTKVETKPQVLQQTDVKQQMYKVEPLVIKTNERTQ